MDTPQPLGAAGIGPLALGARGSRVQYIGPLASGDAPAVRAILRRLRIERVGAVSDGEGWRRWRGFGWSDESNRLGDLDELLVLLVPVVVVTEHRERGGKRRIVPAPRDPAGHVDDPHRAQRLAEGERRAVELAEELVALQEILPELARLF